MVTDTLLVGGATLVCHAFGAVTSLLLRSLLDPALMGIWQGLKTFLSYGNYTNLGISKGATQELAMARGRGDPSSARQGLNLAYTVNSLSSLFYCVALCSAAAWIAARNSGPWSRAWALGLAAIGVLSLLQRHVTFLVTILRARQEFAATSRLSIIEAVLTLVASAAAIALCGLPGMYVATAIVLLASWAYLHHRGAEPLRWAWNLPEIRRLISIGGPILLAGIASSLFRSLDKLMILGYLENREHQLGCYSLALMVSTQLYGLANMLSTVMGPRYSELLGHSQSRRDVARLAARASEMQAAALALSAGLALIAAPPVLRWLLPEYQTGLVPLLWLIPGLLAAGMALPASQYLIAVNQGRRVVAALLTATGIAALGNHWVLTHGGGLPSVAMVTSIANFVYLAILVTVSLWPQLNSTERWRYLGVLGLTLGSNLALVILLSPQLESIGQDFPRYAGGALLIAVGWLACVLVGWRYGGWSSAWQMRRTG